MKLELARAMLYNADLLLLDEVMSLSFQKFDVHLTRFHSSPRITYI